MDKITFVQHIRNALSKTYHADGKVSSFPGAKTLTSVEKEVPFTVDGLREKHRLMQLFARKGFAMMKGPLTKILDRESRAGKSDRNASTRTMVLDFDGITIPGYETPEKMQREDLTKVSEIIVRQLPHCFWHSSYIVTASSSMGTKQGQLGLHMEFWLTNSINPKSLKHYLEHLNYTSTFFAEQLRLTEKQAALSYRIDLNLAENSRMIYIAPPVFQLPENNPFMNDKDRIVLVEKTEPMVNLTVELMQVKLEWNKLEAKKRYEALHLAATGVKPQQAKTKRLQLASGMTTVRTNPTEAVMTIVADYGDYVTFNVNNGDSAGYYVRKDEPEIVRNFKGEENFLFRQADAETYTWFMDHYLPAQEADKKKSTGNTDRRKVVPFAYINRSGDTVKYGFYDKDNNELLEMEATTLGSKIIDSWFTRNGAVPPESLPFVKEEFAPQDPRTIDINEDQGVGFINTFKPKPVFFSKLELPAEATNADMSCIEKMKIVAPTIYDLLQHITCGGKEFPYFVNWLAAIFQTREKMRTAWVIHGVQGTGKGSLTDKVLKPILDQAIKIMNVKTLSEQYNAWLADSLIVTVEEFKNANADHAGQMNNRLKEYITEYYVPVRVMRKDFLSCKNYVNFIFFSNEYDAVYIEDTDRRFNVCPRQEISILQRYPDWKKRVEKDVPKEVEHFVRFMMLFKVDMQAATTALDNKAKQKMQESSRRTQDSFVNAIRTGDLDYFVEVLEIPTPLQDGEQVRAAKNAVKVIIRDHVEGQTVSVTNSELRSMYGALVGRTGSAKKFGKMMTRLGLESRRVYQYKSQSRGVEVKWQLNEVDRQRLMQQHGIEKLIVQDQVNSMDQFIAPDCEKQHDQN